MVSVNSDEFVSHHHHHHHLQDPPQPLQPEPQPHIQKQSVQRGNRGTNLSFDVDEESVDPDDEEGDLQAKITQEEEEYSSEHHQSMRSLLVKGFPQKVRSMESKPLSRPGLTQQ